ncbi:hypothetical protein KR94_11145 [Pantoea ananatis]|nr:hypothetical protein KR94_11145 [Pantoea ananatis]
MTVGAVRRHLRKRVATARSEVVRLVRLAGGGAPPAEDMAIRNQAPTGQVQPVTIFSTLQLS